jgi:hypothetical protein
LVILGGAMLLNLQGICIEDIPAELRGDLELTNNGGNVISVDKGSALGDWLQSSDFAFEFDMPRKEGYPKTWAWLVVFR